MQKEAKARIKINKLLEESGWRFFKTSDGPATITVEPNVKLEDTGDNFEKVKKGYVDYLLTNNDGFPVCVLEAKSEDKDPLIGKQQARNYANSQKVRFIILSNGNIHYLWDKEWGNPTRISRFPSIDTLNERKKYAPDVNKLIKEEINDDYVVLSQNPYYHQDPRWKDESLKKDFIFDTGLRFLRPYQLDAVKTIQGVKPHKKFSIQAKRSEVLFVDYIMEHLNPNGKAGIIVPEGIIFQSATAYKALRKMMIDQNYLYAVVSLPSGIFQPYSGVKTSILLMDRVLAKKTKDILFVKVENDGFDLGAQRRSIDKNDLPQATDILQRYKMSIQTGKPFELSEEDKRLASLIPIEKISKSGDYNLSGDRYKETKAMVNQKWPLVELGQICEIKGGKRLPQEKGFANEKTDHPYLRVVDFFNGTINYNNIRYIDNDVYNDIRNYTISKDDVYISIAGTIGLFGCIPDYLDGANLTENAAKIIINVDSRDSIDKYYIANIGMSDFVQNQVKKLTHAVGVPKLALERIRTLKIPLPPLEVQQAIVSQLNVYQKIIDGAKQVVDNYKPEIKIDPEWEMVKLGGVCEIGSSKRVFESEWENSGVPFYRAREIVKLANQGFVDNELFISEEMLPIPAKSATCSR